MVQDTPQEGKVKEYKCIAPNEYRPEYKKQLSTAIEYDPKYVCGEYKGIVDRHTYLLSRSS